MHGRWVSIAGRLYYTFGLTYYVYEWSAALGLVGMASAVVVPIVVGRLSYYPVFAFPVFLILLVVSTARWVKKSKYALRGNNPCLHMLLDEVCYSVISETSYEISRKVKFKSLRDDIPFYEHKFIWTGSGSISIADNHVNPKCAIEDDSSSHYKIYRCSFPRPLRKGEESEHSYVFELTDPDKTAKPFLNKNIHEPIKELILRVNFRSNKPKEIKKQILMSDISKIPAFEETITLGTGSNEYEWKIKRPRLDYSYRLIW